jgi:hypothetical protein
MPNNSGAAGGRVVDLAAAEGRAVAAVLAAAESAAVGWVGVELELGVASAALTLVPSIASALPGKASAMAASAPRSTGRLAHARLDPVFRSPPAATVLVHRPEEDGVAALAAAVVARLAVALPAD